MIMQQHFGTNLSFTETQRQQQHPGADDQNPSLAENGSTEAVWSVCRSGAYRCFNTMPRRKDISSDFKEVINLKKTKTQMACLVQRKRIYLPSENNMTIKMHING
ncbi:hypothetical protein AMECASPLE_015582 [Ameca splendens]|uniref:Uncharacterized protein n=1 Tax=Ameca splendens TaxID=208324 RepID=A0ABV1A9C5_9TELE